MDRSFSAADEAFRQQVRAFIRDHYPPEMRVKNPYTDPTEPATIAGSLPGDRPGPPSRADPGIQVGTQRQWQQLLSIQCITA
jgi:hypothetical protein